MILKIFKSQSPVIFFILVIYTFLLWSDVFYFNDSNFFLANNDNVLFKLSFAWLENKKYLSLFLSLIFIIIQAIWLNIIVVNTDITAKGTLIPGMTFITLLCSNQAIMSFNGVILSGFFILYILQISFNIYGKADSNMDIFKISMAISIASLFYLPMFLYIIFVLSILMVYRTINIKIIIISMVGLLIPYIYVLFFYFWFDKTPIFINHITDKYNSLFIHHIDFRIYLSLIPLIVGLLYLISVVGLLRKINSRIIKIRKYIYIVLWLLILSLIIAMFFSDSKLISISLLCIPASFFVSDYLLSFKKKWLAELLLFFLIVLIIVEKVLQIHQ